MASMNNMTDNRRINIFKSEEVWINFYAHQFGTVREDANHYLISWIKQLTTIPAKIQSTPE